MSLKELELAREYRSLHKDVVKEFYSPVLSCATLYRRAVGFFSSSALICLVDGLKGLVLNGGKVEVIASPRLSEDDIEAINDGYERRDEVIKRSLLDTLDKPRGKFEEDRLNLLSNLIATGLMTLKIAVLDSGNTVGMFHEKLGIVEDGEGNSVVFSGSMNESMNAFYANYESIDVFTSWDDAERVNNKISAFNAMWNDYEPGIKTYDYPEISEEIIKRYRTTDSVDFSVLDHDSSSRFNSSSSRIDGPELSGRNFIKAHYPCIPPEVELRSYQVNAINEWASRSYRGIFDMATGTGKTYTALAAIATLSDYLAHKLAVVIVCPYQHLVEQWKEDIVFFGMKPIVCYSASKQRNWRERVKTTVNGFRAGVLDHFCIVTTNATFATDFMKEQIGRLSGNCLIVVDEAHNFGAKNLSASLPESFRYRLALSATIDRHGDEEGTERLYNYFGEKCIEYTLKNAIDNKMLTPYYYYPICVSLNDIELEDYIELTKKIKKAIGQSSDQTRSSISDYAKMLLIKRARLVAAASSKLDALENAIYPYRDKAHILVYCGATTVDDLGYEEGNPEEGEVRQIDAVVRRLSDLGMGVAKFTSEENAEKRELLKKRFSEGRHQQALVAIRCLDEGVNIPSIKTAFILASSTNPKEYVQRRGRVLRKSEGKSYAEIFDFVTLPVSLGEASSLDEDTIEATKSLAIREVTRMKDFAGISENPAEADGLIAQIIEEYNISIEEEWGENYV